MKTLFAILAATLLGQPSPGNNSQPLEIFRGHWVGGGTFYETRMSKPGKVTSEGDCSWSPQKRYMACEQTIHDPSGTHDQLTVFRAKEKPGEFMYQTFQDGREPRGGTVINQGGSWSFENTFPVEGVSTTLRTTNTFTGDTEKFRVEYTQDNGQHWTLMLDGELHKTSGVVNGAPH